LDAAVRALSFFIRTLPSVRESHPVGQKYSALQTEAYSFHCRYGISPFLKENIVCYFLCFFGFLVLIPLRIPASLAFARVILRLEDFTSLFRTARFAI
jgi:GT2 family glycosyltransferase